MTENARELVPYFKQMGMDLAPDMLVEDMLVPFSDHYPFVLQGVPAAEVGVRGNPGTRGWGHTAADTLEKVNVQSIRQVAALMARVAVRMGNDLVPWPGHHRTLDEVKAALQTYGVQGAP